MERIFPNLYRFTDEPFRKGRKYAYLIVRKKGNLLLPFKGGSVSDHFKEIERLGGVDTQFITHSHDADRNLNDEVHARFGAKLRFNEAEAKKVRSKTKCPSEPFGDDGLELDSDFQALYFPSCTSGLSIYRWRSRGKFFLFTSHVINMAHGNWFVDLDPGKALPHLCSPVR